MSKDHAISTRTRVPGKALSLVPVERIRPTDPPHPDADVRKIRYSPIVLVMAEDQYCYIVDGNHRYYQKTRSGGYSKAITAWVLEEGDERK